MNYLSIDIGTTGCKCQLFSEKGEILQYLFEEYDFLASDGCQYVDIYAIEKHLRQMIGSISQQHKIDSVCISSLGESFVLLDKEDIMQTQWKPLLQKKMKWNMVNQD